MDSKGELGGMFSHSNPNPTQYSKALTPSLAVTVTIGVTQPLALILLVRGIALFYQKTNIKNIYSLGSQTGNLWI